MLIFNKPLNYIFFSLIFYFSGLVSVVAIESLDFITGKALFGKQWVFAPASTAASDGLGPYFNARSCSSCHADGGRGTLANALVVHTDDAGFGSQLQKFTRPGVPPEIDFDIKWVVNDEGLVWPQVNFAHAGLHETIPLSIRLAPSLAGLGQLATIPDAVLLAMSDEHDSNGDGISGRVNRLPNGSIGRFGWKASQSGLREQTARALSLDLGLGNPVHPSPWGDCTPTQSACLDAPEGNSDSQGGLEVSEQVLYFLTRYVTELPAPGNYLKDNRGLSVFTRVGCNDCHRSSISGEKLALAPYTDLLLHDMGPGLADSLAEGSAMGSEWRTAPLWGLRKINKTSGFLHDGRATSLHEAILWHDGEARAARAAYLQLNDVARDDLISFLNGL